MAKFKIPAENLGSLRKKINHIKRKCEDLNLPFYYSEDSVEYVKERDEFHRVYTRKYVNITVEATAIVNGWHFVGQIEHNQEGNLIHNKIIYHQWNCKESYRI